MKWLFQLKNTSSRRDKLLQTVDVMVYFTLFFFSFFLKSNNYTADSIQKVFNVVF